MSRNFVFTLAMAMILNLTAAFAGNNAPAPKNTRSRTPASAAGTVMGNTTAEKPLEIRGQARNLSMRLILQNKKDRIQFIEHRKDYRPEVLNTMF